MNREFNVQVWNGERELTFVPPHFVRCYTTITDESLFWVISSLIGRYTTQTHSDFTSFNLDINTFIYFEDPSEAMLYELRWSGSK
jgi:hypothetical protein